MGDPVGTGLVASLARPGGNVTGLRRLAFLGNVGNPITVLEMGEVQTAARTLGVDLVTLEIRRPEDIVPAFETLKSDAQALYVAGDPLWLS